MEEDSVNKEFNHENEKANILNEDGKIELVQEELHVSKVREAIGEVIIKKDFEVVEESLNIPLTNEEIFVERVKFGKEIDEYPVQREVDGKTIIPVVREKLVVVKQLVLVEEIHITKKVSETVEKVTDTVRRDTIKIERNKI